MNVLLGIASGVVAAAPLVLSLRRAAPGVGLGLVSVMASFLLMQGALLVAALAWPGEVVPFGTLAVLTFLALVVAAVISRERS